MGRATVHAKARVIEPRLFLGSVWLNKDKTTIVAIVKIVRDHPDRRRADDIVVLALDLLTGTTEERVYNVRKGEFEWMPLKRL